MLRQILTPLVALSLSACAGAPPASDRGLCAGLEPLGRAHAEALLADGGDASVVTGARLLAGLDAGCGRSPAAASRRSASREA